jgi:hypothetical protein
MLVAISELTRTSRVPQEVLPRRAAPCKRSRHRPFKDCFTHFDERGRHDPAVRSVVVIVAVVAAAAAVAVVGLASTSAAGLPSYTDGYAKWARINAKPFTRCGPPCAHSGVKNVYASKRKVGKRYPNGSVIVKTIAQAGATGLPGQVAVMRKVDGRWRFVEYRLSGSRYTVLAQGQLCQSCHMRARANDYVFTKR